MGEWFLWEVFWVSGVGVSWVGEGGTGGKGVLLDGGGG